MSKLTDKIEAMIKVAEQRGDIYTADFELRPILADVRELEETDREVFNSGVDFHATETRRAVRQAKREAYEHALAELNRISAGTRTTEDAWDTFTAAIDALDGVGQ